MKYSKQRDLILKVIESSYDHPCAEEIYERVKKDLPRISLGTVYRNLNQLEEVGMIRRLRGNDYDRFDKVSWEHDHFQCLSCGEIYDLQKIDLSVLSNQITRETGYFIQNHELNFTGICFSCNNGKKV